MDGLCLENSSISQYFKAPGAEFFGGSGSANLLAGDAEFLSSGRAAMDEIAKSLRAETGVEKPVLHIPEYLCPALTEFLEARFDIRRYSDNPALLEPRFETLRASPPEAVLAVNFFGNFNDAAWRRWKAANPKIALVADHSHAPFSPFALGEYADYTFASFRKILPLCGAFLRRKGRAPRRIFRGGRDNLNRYEAQILAAGLMKSRLGPSDTDWKRIFNIFEKAERLLEYDFEDRRMSFYALDTLLRLDAPLLSRRREENFRLFAMRLRELTPEGVHILNERTIEKPFCGHDVFYPAIVFANHDARNLARAALRQACAEPPVFWAKIKSSDADAKDLSERIMTLPLTHDTPPSAAVRAADIIAGALSK